VQSAAIVTYVKGERPEHDCVRQGKRQATDWGGVNKDEKVGERNLKKNIRRGKYQDISWDAKLVRRFD